VGTRKWENRPRVTGGQTIKNIKKSRQNGLKDNTALLASRRGSGKDRRVKLWFTLRRKQNKQQKKGRGGIR